MTTQSPPERGTLLPLGRIRRVVVKLGSATLTDPAKGLRETTLRAVAAQVCRGWDRGVRFAVVTSGAIAAGRKKLGMAERPRTVSLKQAAAAVGQTSLMRAWERAFERHGRHVAQLLLTHENFEHRERYNNVHATMETLLARGIVPIVNENDTVATEEIRFGDNDRLAALVAQLLDADLLVLLTDLGGLYTKDPHRHPDARRIPLVASITDGLIASARNLRVGAPGTGGMASKLAAARAACETGIPVVIASGLSRSSLSAILAGKDEGTLFLPSAGPAGKRRKVWIAYARHPHGTITVDDGARRVLREGGKSLLAAGIVGVLGTFRPGDAISIGDRLGRIFARGITRWSSEQIERGMGRKSAEAKAILGEGVPPEVVHRDDLTILPEHGTEESSPGA